MYAIRSYYARSMGRTYQYYLTNIADLHYVTDFTMFSPSTAVSRTSLKIMLNVGMMILIISLVNNLYFQLSVITSYSIHYTKLYEFVSAVVRDIPDNSELSFDMVATLPLYVEVFGNWVNTWPMHAASSYLLLKPGADSYNFV